MSVEPAAEPVEPAAEPVEVVDERGEVIDIVSRAEIRAGTLRHRCTYIAVVTADDRLVVHRRAEWKDVYPGYWDVCFGGVCGVGEAWEPAARRELLEEAGLSVADLIDLGPVRYDEEDGRIVGRVYLARSDGEPSCPDGEVVEIDRVSAAKIDAWLADRQVCHDSARVALPLVLDHLGF